MVLAAKRIPQVILTCLTAFTSCFKPRADRPTSPIYIGNECINALFDTGSAVTLCDSEIRVPLSAKPSLIPRQEVPNLHSANGSQLEIVRALTVTISLDENHRYRHPVIFVRGLQVPCIIGMDFMRKAKVLIDTGGNQIRLTQAKEEMLYEPSPPRRPFRAPTAPSPKNQELSSDGSSSEDSFVICSSSDVTIPPMEEAKVTCVSPVPFNSGITESLLCDKTYVMDGIVKTSDSNKALCNIVAVNFDSQPIFIPKNTPMAKINLISLDQVAPISSILTVTNKRISPVDISHVQSIKLDHLPENYKEQYRQLLYSYADVFSKHDLDVGHSKTMPHKVRLTDPNKIVSVNQYRLPYHLKEVAIDYVEKLLKSGVIRPSTSVFNSPLMLVKKPNADPTKPLGEQYRLVHNGKQVRDSTSSFGQGSLVKIVIYPIFAG